MYGVLGLGNCKLYGKFRDHFNINKDDPEKPAELSSDAPGIEYK